MIRSRLRLPPSAGAAIVVALLTAVIAGCGGDSINCTTGFVLVGDACKPVNAAFCGAGTVFDAATKTCVLDTSAKDVVADAEADTGGDVTADAETAGDAQTDVGADVPADPTLTADIQAPDVACTPSCEGRVCGDNACGGSCGDCPNKQLCTTDGKCVAPPDCSPSCTDKVCGDDGCGGSCGACADPAKPICDKGACLAGCVPDCVGKECGADGCGGQCGSCKDDASCSTIGHCVPKAWTCPSAQYEGADGCHCGCGAHDLDCDILGQPLLGCAQGKVCDGTGACADKVPKAWTCPAFFYDDKLLCHCACGAPDPDCADANNLIIDCKAGGCDKKAGVCGVCKPQCDGKACGDDGCGGSCGTCSDPKLPGCAAGVCVEKCTPDCSGKSCGSDGCGGSCGSCKVGAVCSSGSCVAEAGKSCVSHCGYQTTGGCWCDEGCVQRGDCCADVDHCFCTPSCKDKVCGDNGCGGSCGTCSDPKALYCDAGKCSGTCKPNCTYKACGDDGCGGSCGSCKAGSTCSDQNQCVPDAWVCDAHLYATAGPLATCDCSCGAPDPDCKAKGPITGCPGGAVCLADKGVCDAKWCTSQKECGKPAWCIGDYPTGTGKLEGICAPPNPIGYAPGHPCSVDEACATGLCVAGSCRVHCEIDGDCPSGQACVGDEQLQPLTGKPRGVVGFCDTTGSVGKTCNAHKECAADELCLALTDPKTLKVMGRCGIPHGGVPEGLSCKEGAECALGLLCAEDHCARPCFGGASECGATAECKPATLHHGATPDAGDDVKVSACVAKAVK